VKTKLHTNYYRKCSTAIEFAYYWKQAFIKRKDLTYIDFICHIDDYDLIKKAGRKLIKNYLSKIKFPVFGVYERAPKKINGKFCYHIHVVVACREDQLNRKDISRAWAGIIKKLAPQTFHRTYVESPDPVHPFKKFLYYLKFKKSWKPVKPYGQKGSFYFHANSQPLPWLCKEQPKDIMDPEVIERLQYRYFNDPKNHRYFISYVDYYYLSKTNQYKKNRFKRI